MATAQQTSPTTRRPRPARVGVVVSDRGDKTIGVVFRFSVKHPRYGKYIKRKSKVLAHDETNQAKLGDVVEVTLCRPISKHKSWRLVRVVEAAPEQPSAVASAEVGAIEGA